MVVRAAGFHGVFLRESQAGYGFTGIQQFDGSFSDQRCITRACGGSAGEALQKVQGRSFCGQQAARFAARFEDGAIGFNGVAILYKKCQLYSRVYCLENCFNPRQTSNDGLFAAEATTTGSGETVG